MDGGLCVHPAASEFALCSRAGHDVMAAEIVRTIGGVGGRWMEVLHAVMGAGHAQTSMRFLNNFYEGGPEVESGGAGCGDGQAGSEAHGQAGRTDGDQAGAVDVDAGNPAAHAAIAMLPGPSVNAAVCVDAEFGDADLLAAPAVASRRRGRRRSCALRLGLRRRPFDAHGDATCELRPARPASATSGSHKNGNWSNDSLQAAMNAVTDNGMPLRQVDRFFGVPTTSLRDHLYGTTRGRHKGIAPTLKSHEEKKIVNYVFKMQDLGHPLTPMQLWLKVAVATQGRSTPWSAFGVPGKRWLRRFRRRHLQVVYRHSQGLEITRARALNPTTAETLYANLEFLYSSYKYPLTHIWNCDESTVYAGRSSGAIVLAKRGNRSVHSLESNQREHLSVLSCINADGGSIPNFYILKGSYFLEDYIARCEPGAVMGMQQNVWMTRWLFESWISHFLEYLKTDSV